MKIFLFSIFLLQSFYSLSDIDDKKKLDDMIHSARELRALMQSDPHRPIYHFVAPEGHAWPFDPNGAIYWKGRYHLGYIYAKRQNGTRRAVWGHAVSTDLVHWKIYPDMIDVKDGDIEWGVFSGGAFLSREGVPHIIYYGLGAEANMIAYATDDDLKVWKKFESNPVLKAPGQNEYKLGYCCSPQKGDFSVFDPDAWYDEKSDNYYQISGGLNPGLFKSKDMRKWEFLGELIDKSNTMRYPFEDIACPDFFSLGGKKSMLLFLSHALGAQYYIGEFSDDRFIPEKHGRMNWPGGTFFAPEQLQDAQGRNIIWGWVMQPRKFSERQNLNREASVHHDYGWSGIMSLPRVVSLDHTGELQINPAEELKSIRLNELNENDIVLPPNEERALLASGKSIELEIEIIGGRSPFGIKVFASPDGREETIIRYEPEGEQLVIDFVNSSINSPVSIPTLDPNRYDSSKHPFKQYTNNVSSQKAPLKLERGEKLKLNVFLDRSIIEVFANGRQAVTQVVYPELETSIGVRIFSGNEAVTFKNIKSWQMAEAGAY